MIKIFQGLRIRVENPAGSTRSGVDKDGKPWSTTMTVPYGEIIGSMGVDGDPVDCFIGNNKHAKFVYIITTTHKENGKFDEQKVMLGFDNAMDAKETFVKNYDQANLFYGDVSTLSMDEFKKKLFQTKKNPTMIRASKMENMIQLYAMMDRPSGGNPFVKGEECTCNGFHGRGMVIGSEGRRVTVRFWNREYISRDYTECHKMDEGNYKSRYSSVHSSVEQEGIPEETGRGNDKWIEKVGTQYCIRTNGVDPNLGCWPSMEKAKSVMSGRSFIEPDVPKNLLAGGPGSGRKPSTSKGLNKWKSDEQERKAAAKDPKQMKLPLKAAGPPHIKFHIASPFKTPTRTGTKPAPSSMNKVGNVNHKMPNPQMKNGKGSGHRLPNPAFASKKIEAVDWGEPLAGAYQHAHMDTNLWFTPPSLAKRGKGTYVPTDDLGEKDNKFLDVDKRKEATKQRMGLLKKSAPGGTPPSVPVRTTLISPTLNSYLPMYGSAIQASKARQRRRHGGGNFRAYGAAQI